ncbi:MAG: hypothetical protein PVJ34_16875 [Anaerolineae bacterium]|jgi:hypothetical protein
MHDLHLRVTVAMMDMARESARRERPHPGQPAGARHVRQSVRSGYRRRLQARLGAWLVTCGRGLQARAGRLAEPV